MGSSHSPRKHTGPDAAKAAAGADAQHPTGAAGQASDRPAPPHTEKAQRSGEGGADSGTGQDRRTVTVTLPSLGRVADGAMNVATFPIAAARQILPAKKGLPLYLGLGVLGAADVIEWPVAFGIGLGYAVLRGNGLPAGRGSSAPGPARGEGTATA